MQVLFPSFTSSDRELDITYAYRCELYQRHVKQTPAGYVITEFLPDVPWAGIYNTISCAASHHFREGRWMRDPTPLADYAKFWCTVGNPRLYSFPIADSILALAKVTGNFSAAEALYPMLQQIHRAWDDHKTASGMYRQLCDRDGMEYSISGDGIRPTINSYLYADTVALAVLAERRCDDRAAEAYRREADTLRLQINTRLWNDNIHMYGTLSEDGQPQNVREQIGYIPWIYSIPDRGKDGCFRYLLDSTCFLSPYGLRTADASHPDYRKYYKHSCLWNGPVWPFATAQTLTAVAEYLQTTALPVISPKDFMQLLLTFAYSHRDSDGTPWLDENMDPDTGIWLAREILRNDEKNKMPDRGRHYNHSTFLDLVITGLCGIRPAEGNILEILPLGRSLAHFTLRGVLYHGHDISIHWQQDSGLQVTVDGSRTYFQSAADTAALRIEL